MAEYPISTRTGVLVRDGSCKGEELLEAFILALKADGVRVGGVYQRTVRPESARKRMVLVDAMTDAVIPISQDLGAGSTACVLDADGLACGAMAVRRAIDAKVDLVVVNKFSTRECEGKGLAPELFEAIAGGLVVLTSVSERYLDQWTAMSGGFGLLLPAQEGALRAWWDEARAAVEEQA